MSALEGPSWVFPETVSFLIRRNNGDELHCIAEAASLGATEALLLLISSLIFFLNCVEFSRPPRQVILVYTASALLSGSSVLMMVSEASISQGFTVDKYYTTIFESLAASGSAIIMGYFYLYHNDKKIA